VANHFISHRDRLRIAAASSGALPRQLDDITDTPVPQDPKTGKPFDYHVQGDVAILSDSQPDAPLRYTIRIRK
jgi:hypothetical protein